MEISIDELHLRLMSCYSSLNNLLIDVPHNDVTEEVGQLFEAYSALASAGYLDGGSDVLASGIIESGQRVASSAGRMITKITFDVLESIWGKRFNRPVLFHEFSPELHSIELAQIRKLSQTNIRQAAKQSAKITTGELEKTMQRMLSEFEIVDQKRTVELAKAGDPLAGYYEASDDFLSVNYCDDTGEIHRFSFNHKQAKVVSIYAAKKFPVSDRDMLNELGEQESVSSRLRDVFKCSDNSVHEAWGTFIVPDSSGKSPVKRKLNAKKT